MRTSSSMAFVVQTQQEVSVRGQGSRRWAALLGFSLLVAVGLCAARSAGGGVVASVPQGTVVFMSDRTGNFEIYSVRADGSQLGQLTRNGLRDSAPLFSPNGRRIMFVRAPEGGASELWVMNADGSGQRKLTGRGYSPAWSPDSRRSGYAPRHSAPGAAVLIRGPRRGP